MSAFQTMGLQFGLDRALYCKRSFRWLFYVPGVCADNAPGVNALPPEKGARPNLNFKELEVRHLNEDVYYPAKPDWQPITLTLFDLNTGDHPVFRWLRALYDPSVGDWSPPVTPGQSLAERFIKDCALDMLDAVGNRIERWIFEDVWPRATNFQTLDMGQSNVVMCDVTLRYARAYIEN